MLQLFSPVHFDQLANYLIRAQKRRFAVGGVDLMLAQAAGLPATMNAASLSQSTSGSDTCSFDDGLDDDASSDDV